MKQKHSMKYEHSMKHEHSSTKERKGKAPEQQVEAGHTSTVVAPLLLHIYNIASACVWRSESHHANT